MVHWGRGEFIFRLCVQTCQHNPADRSYAGPASCCRMLNVLNACPLPGNHVTLVLSHEVRFPSSVFLGTYEVSSEPTVSKSSCLRIPRICTNTGFFPTNEQLQIFLARGFTPSSAQSSGGSSEGPMGFQGSNPDCLHASQAYYRSGHTNIFVCLWATSGVAQSLLLSLCTQKSS